MAETQPSAPMPKAHGTPTKNFFVRMITRDITLADCILDLIDNSIDGARRSSARSGDDATSSAPLKPYSVNVEIAESRFEIFDNCGGISLSDAVDYAFHFGRRKDAPSDVDHAIGLYGIGMKRAIFKIGRKARVESRPSGDAFVVEVDVDKWEANDLDWDFDLGTLEADSTIGTRIIIENIYPKVAAVFADPSFTNQLIRTIARDYAFIIGKGFSIVVNKTLVPHYDYTLKEGEDIHPAVVEYDDGGVHVRIVAGLMKELSDEVPEELRPDQTDPYGWYVICNDRVVLAGDKTDKTVWGNQNFRSWHNQYNGFAGFAFFESTDPKLLPWTTTKRELDEGDPLYLRALIKMKKVTDDFASYTNRRKADPVSAKLQESTAKSVSVTAVPATERPMRLPKVAAVRVDDDSSTISYRKPRAEIKETASALGDSGMAASEVGRRTFEYFRRMELGK